MKRFIFFMAVVFIGLGGSSASHAQLFGNKNDDSAVRLNELEDRMRYLTGQVEQMTYQLRELQDQLRRMQEDNEYRFQELENSKSSGKRSDAGPSLNSQKSENVAALPQTRAEQAVQGGGNGFASGAGPLDLSRLASGSLPGDNGSAGYQNFSNTGDPRTDYDQAYSSLVNGDYSAASDGFRAFVELYPEHKLAGNARYWLGESLLAQKNYRGAADEFLKTYKEYPANAKRPDSLLKLGIALGGIGEAGAACATFSELQSKFPNASTAVLQHARDEQRRAKCS